MMILLTKLNTVYMAKLLFLEHSIYVYVYSYIDITMVKYWNSAFMIHVSSNDILND